MTIPEFLERLRATPRTWFWAGHALRIYWNERNFVGRACPLTAVCEDRDYRLTEHSLAARDLGLTTKDDEDISSCADFKVEPTDTEANKYYQELRRKLVEACGLTES